MQTMNADWVCLEIYLGIFFLSLRVYKLLSRLLKCKDIKNALLCRDEEVKKNHLKDVFELTENKKK